MSLPGAYVQHTFGCVGQLELARVEQVEALGRQVSVGSRSNVSDDASEARRARIFEYTPDGKNERVFATGIRT